MCCGVGTTAVLYVAVVSCVQNCGAVDAASADSAPFTATSWIVPTTASSSLIVPSLTGGGATSSAQGAAGLRHSISEILRAPRTRHHPYSS